MPHRIDTPVRGERVRCAIARTLYLHHLYFHKLALLITPQDHPWRRLIESTHEQMRELTTTTLRPRNRLGFVQAKANATLAVSPAARISWVLLGVWLVYAVVARSTDLVPPILPVFTEGEDAIVGGRAN